MAKYGGELVKENSSTADDEFVQSPKLELSPRQPSSLNEEAFNQAPPPQIINGPLTLNKKRNWRNVLSEVHEEAETLPLSKPRFGGELVTVSNLRPIDDSAEKSGFIENTARGVAQRSSQLFGGLMRSGQAASDALEDKFALGGWIFDGGLPKYYSGKSYKEKLNADGIKEPLGIAADYYSGVEAGYVPEHTWEVVKESFSDGVNLSDVGEVFAYGAEQGIKSIPDMAAVILTLPAYVTARSGEIGEERALNKGKDGADISDVLEAAPFALGSALLEKVGAGRIINPADVGREALEAGISNAAKRIGKDALESAGTEAATEFVQEGIIEYVGEKFGTDAEMFVAEAVDRGLAGALAGGVFGGAAGAVSSTASEISGNRNIEEGEVNQDGLNADDFKQTEETITPEVEVNEGIESSIPPGYKIDQETGEYVPVEESVAGASQVEPVNDNEVNALNDIDSANAAIQDEQDINQSEINAANADELKVQGPTAEGDITNHPVYAKAEERYKADPAFIDNLGEVQSKLLVTREVARDLEKHFVDKAEAESQGDLFNSGEDTQSEATGEEVVSDDGVAVGESPNIQNEAESDISDTAMSETSPESDISDTAMSETSPESNIKGETASVKYSYEDVVSAGINNTEGNKAFNIYRDIDSVEAEQLKQVTGVDVSGFQHGIDESAIRHILKEHGDQKREESKGQVAITAKDLALIPEITIPENIDKSGSRLKDGSDLGFVRYQKRVNGHVLIVEEVRDGRNRLALKTMWKVSAAPSAPAEKQPLAQASETFRAQPSTSGESISQNIKPDDLAAPSRQEKLLSKALDEVESYTDALIKGVHPTTQKKIISDGVRKRLNNRLVVLSEGAKKKHKSAGKSISDDLNARFDKAMAVVSDDETSTPDDDYMFSIEQEIEEAFKSGKVKNAGDYISSTEQSKLDKIDKTIASVHKKFSENGKGGAIAPWLDNYFNQLEVLSEADGPLTFDELVSRVEAKAEKAKSAAPSGSHVKVTKTKSGYKAEYSPDTNEFEKAEFDEYLEDASKDNLFDKSLDEYMTIDAANKILLDDAASKPDSANSTLPKPIDIKSEGKPSTKKTANKKTKAIPEGKEIVNNLDLLEVYFKAGRIVEGYSGKDEVVSFDRQGGTNWTVTVKSVGDDNHQRTHSTIPSNKSILDILKNDGYEYDGKRKRWYGIISNQESDNTTIPPNGKEDGKPEELIDNVLNDLKKVDDGELSINEFQESFKRLFENRDAIETKLSAMTIPKMKYQYGHLISHRHYDGRKNDIVESIFDGLVTGYLSPTAKGGMISFSHGVLGGGKKTKYQTRIEKVEAITQADLDEYAESVTKNRKERELANAERDKGIENPQTVQDYKNKLNKIYRESDDVNTFLEGRAKLPLEERIDFDRLIAEETRSSRTFDKNAHRSKVTVAGQAVDGEIIETTHTKKGHDLFVVQLAERASREDYLTLNTSAKRIGGYYSKFRGNGAIPGFTFTDRDNAEAFVKLAQGDSEQASNVAKERRNEFQDVKSQSAVERLNGMADKLLERAEASSSQERKTNTARRAGMAANAEAKAESDRAMAKTMSNIAAAIESGEGGLLDQVRTKVQVEMLDSFIHMAKSRESYEMFPGDYAKQQNHLHTETTKDTAELVEFPTYTAWRSDLAKLGRQLQELSGTKRFGDQLLKVADDSSKQYLAWVKENLRKVSTFGRKDGGLAAFSTKTVANASIISSGFGGEAISYQVKHGEHVVILSASAAQNKGVWDGQEDKKISLSQDFARELISKLNRKSVDIPWILESASTKRNRLSAMNIETPAEFRAMMQEYIALQEIAAEPDKIKAMERKMIGRRNDGLDFFPTPASIAGEMIDTANIEEGMSVLEPSAGMGHIADQLRVEDVEADVIEMSGDRRELLKAKGYNIVGNDFLEHGEKYDRIIMNPPFSDRRDFEHVQHAYDLLKPNGRLVSIVGEGIFFGSDKKTQAFRDWFDSVGGTDEKLAEGTFNDSSLPVNTGVNARMIVIDKGETGDSAFSVSDDASIRARGLADIQEPVSVFTKVDKLKAHRDYKAAKSGDMAAAERLVRELVPKRKFAYAENRFGSDVTYVAVHGEEATGLNAIPGMLAGLFASATKSEYDTEIVQSNQGFHTGAKAMERIMARVRFDGKVEKGKKYVLVDDVSTIGSTLAELANYIYENGGEVSGTVLLANSSRTGTMAPTRKQVSIIERRFGNEVRELFGIEPEALTASEAGYLVGFRDANELKNRATKAEQERIARLRSKGIRSEPSNLSLSDANSNSGLTKDQVEQAIADTVLQWESAPIVNVVATKSDLPKEILYDVDRQERISGKSVNGQWERNSNSVYLIADKINSTEQAAKVLRHEVIGHFAFERTFQKDIKQIFSRIDFLKRSDPRIRELAADVAKKYPNADKYGQAGEIVARIAEQKIKSPILVRIWSAFKRLLKRLKVPKGILKKLGISTKFDFNDVQAMIAKAMGSLDKPFKDKGNSKNTGYSYSVSEENTQAEEKGLPMDKASRMKRAKEIGFDTDTVYYHGTDQDFSKFENEEYPIWATKDSDEANEHSIKRGDEGANVLPVLVRVNNPLVFDESFDMSEEVDIKDLQEVIDFDISEFEDGMLFEIVNTSKFAILAERNGYDGVKAMENGSPAIAVFSPSQLRSVNAAFDPEYSESTNLSYSVSDENAEFNMGQSPEEMVDEIGKAIKAAPTPSVMKKAGWKIDDWKKAGFYVLGRNHLADIGSKVLPTIKHYVDLAKAMDSDRNHLLSDSGKHADKLRAFAQKNKKMWLRLSWLMHDSTIAGIDPSQEYVPLTTAKETNESIKTLRQHARDESGSSTAVSKYMKEIKDARNLLKQENNRKKLRGKIWRQWKKLSPEAKELYVETRDYYTDHQKSVMDALEDRIRESVANKAHRKKLLDMLRVKFESTEVTAPYFPLSRYGDYWVKITEGEEYSFHMFETKSSQQHFIHTVSQNPDVEVDHGKKVDVTKALGGVSAGFVADVQELLKDLDGPTIDKIKDEIHQLYLTSLPDLSVRKHFIHRGKVSGYSEDAIRSFSSFMFHGSYQLARLKFQPRLESLLEHMDDDIKIATSKERFTEFAEATAQDPSLAGRLTNQRAIKKDPEAATDVLNELNKRHEWAMNPKGGRVANFLSSFGFTFYLGLAPAAAMVNLTQTPMVALPVIGAKYGFGKTSVALTKAMADFFAGKVKGGSFSVEGSLKGDDLQAFKDLEDSGILDKTLGHDLAGMSEQGYKYNSTAHKVMNTVSYMFHHAERFNREITSIAAYRLARSSGKSHSTAVKEAGELTELSHFDYSTGNKARVLQSDTAKVLFLFRQFSLNMTYLLARSAHQSVKGENVEVRKEMRKRLGGILGMSAVFAGLNGLPMMWAVKLALESIFDDEDDPWLFEAEFRKSLVELTGSKTTAEMIARGPVDTITGASFSTRVGLNDLWFRESNRDLEGQAAYQYWLEQIAGPIGGTVGGAFTFTKLANEGHYQRAFESILPLSIKNPLKAHRFNTEGANTFAGNPLVENMDKRDQIMQALGFTPTLLSERYIENNAIGGMRSRLENRRQHLLNRYALAFRLGDTDGMTETIEEIAKFNGINPTLVIKGETIRSSIRARQRNANNSVNGIVLKKNLLYLAKEYDFAK